MHDVKEIPALLSVFEASHLLRRSVPSVRRDLKAGTIAYVRIGSSIRIMADEIKRTIQDGTVERVAG